MATADHHQVLPEKNRVKTASVPVISIALSSKGSDRPTWRGLSVRPCSSRHLSTELQPGASPRYCKSPSRYFQGTRGDSLAPLQACHLLFTNAAPASPLQNVGRSGPGRLLDNSWLPAPTRILEGFETPARFVLPSSFPFRHSKPRGPVASSRINSEMGKDWLFWSPSKPLRQTSAAPAPTRPVSAGSMP